MRSAESLAAEGWIPTSQVRAYQQIVERYGFLLPRYYANLIDKEDPNCPIRRQALPSLEESDLDWGETDPLRDERYQPAPHLTHRYAGRVLLHLSPNCSMYCRYCFRKTLINEEKDTLFGGSLEAAYRYLESQAQVEEVIFSGGDPLMVSDASLATVLKRLESIKSIRTLRFHTRVPVTLPSRITENLVALLNSTHLSTVVVTHFNHPKEITDQSSEACLKMAKAGAWLFNQSVLLRGVNDKAETLAELSKALMAIRTVPYYLHHPDPAQGTRHFWLGYQHGAEIYEQLRSLLPGYLLPRYVVDDIERPYKSPVGEFLAQASSPVWKH
ncbi:MAG: KamA family radical SAM protein [Bdellovibrionaceae bacterium]|nr:KamA family radical SAM protein [Bdellovibrionales bacterium]MCB9253790.1 KamA family radical SAM protein [Pseudobdellovibrionaceae bacterium]